MGKHIKFMSVKQMFVLYDRTLQPLTKLQQNTIISYQLDMEYDTNYFRMPTTKPHFWEFVERPVFFLGDSWSSNVVWSSDVAKHRADFKKKVM